MSHPSHATCRNPDLLAAIRIADHFNVTIDWLIGRNPNKHDAITDEERELIDKYSRASEADKNIVKLFLSKYNNA